MLGVGSAFLGVLSSCVVVQPSADEVGAESCWGECERSRGVGGSWCHRESGSGSSESVVDEVSSLSSPSVDSWLSARVVE